MNNDKTREERNLIKFRRRIRFLRGISFLVSIFLIFWGSILVIGVLFEIDDSGIDSFLANNDELQLIATALLSLISGFYLMFTWIVKRTRTK